jgi:hypothetical protein
MNTDEREDDEGGRDSGTETGGQITVTRALRFACTRRAARAACEISNSKSFFAQFPERFEEPPRGVARRVHAPRTALVRVEARQVRAPAENGDASMGRPVVGRATRESARLRRGVGDAHEWGRVGVNPGSCRGRFGVDFRRTNPMARERNEANQSHRVGREKRVGGAGRGVAGPAARAPRTKRSQPARPAQVPTKNPTGSDPGRRSRTGSAPA